ncbi:MAG: hypothetical protein P4M11_06280 [Candidatus Pacebacteria bacterium]|nr:hypothetical protein [Candidatus Paceibacterota bacterium]
MAAFKDLSVTDKYKDEERSSTYGYLSGYEPKSLTEQCNRLRELFPGVGYPNQDLLAQIEKGEVPLPKGSEGWFAIPNRIKHPQIFGLIYGGAVQKVFNVLKQTRNGKFHNFREGQLGPEYLRLTARTEKFLADLSEVQGNPDILIVPAQFGLRHRGRSVRRAREVYVVNEFGFDPFTVGIMLLTHPERLQNTDDLWIDCGGAEFSPGADGDFSRAPFFYFHGGRVKFDVGWVLGANELYGSVSGFAPQ